MKNLILTTASVLALSAFAVQAAPTQNMNDSNTNQQPGSPSSAMATDGSSSAPSATAPAAPSASTGASSGQMMETQPSTTATAPAVPSASTGASSGQMMETQPSTTATAPAAPSAGAENCPKHHAPKHHAKHHAKRHGKHHGHYAGHPQYPNEAEIGGVFVTFPPMDLNLCKPQNFCGKPECPYISYEGYFWYPEARQNLLAGYTPAQLRGMYWYPSHTHPHMVYATKTRAVYTHPYVLNRPYPMDGAMYTAQEFPMERKWESAPDMRPGQVN